MPDFSALLSKPADDIARPVPNPEGTYFGIINDHKFDEAKTPNDKANPVKAVCELHVRLTEAGDDVDAEALAEALATTEGGIGGRIYNYTLWLTADAQYRAIELCQSCGIDTSGKTLGECISELNNQPVIASIEHVQSKKPGQEDVFFANIATLVGTAAG